MDAPNPDFAEAVRTALQTMPAAAHLGFTVGALTPGTAELVLHVRPEHTQLDGFVAGSVLGALADYAGGSAAGTLLPAGSASMTTDYTVKILAPAKGDMIVARGRVVKAGHSTSVAATDIVAIDGKAETLCATALVTMRNLPGTDVR
ncbi:PaaI family thioesterase [Pseudonocardia kujensis]|uniref:PaaI family thioesterase n=1 Tax=Pseudonocardia kujensis TaxID=1128675 RepID=UPI001E5FE458|nr:PaaI family thioesterase [Pseudonocardia kujensis]MCE0764883.1 PaaI family thioesterase [Pseudonocardia kujensis]